MPFSRLSAALIYSQSKGSLCFVWRQFHLPLLLSLGLFILPSLSRAAVCTTTDQLDLQVMRAGNQNPCGGNYIEPAFRIDNRGPNPVNINTLSIKMWTNQGVASNWGFEQWRTVVRNSGGGWVCDAASGYTTSTGTFGAMTREIVITWSTSCVIPAGGYVEAGNGGSPLFSLNYNDAACDDYTHVGLGSAWTEDVLQQNNRWVLYQSSNIVCEYSAASVPDGNTGIPAAGSSCTCPGTTPTFTPTPTSTPDPCAPAYNNDFASYGPTQICGSAPSNSWTRSGAVANSIMFLVIQCSGSAAFAAGATYGGTPLVYLRSDTANHNGTSRNQHIYYLTNPPTGANNLVLDPNPDNCDNCSWSVFSYSGINPASPLGTMNFSTSQDSSAPYSHTHSSYAQGNANSTTLQLFTLYSCTTASPYGPSQGVARASKHHNVWTELDFAIGDWFPGNTSSYTPTHNFNGGGGCGNSGQIGGLIELKSLCSAGSPTHTPTITRTWSISPTFSRTPTQSQTYTFSRTPTPTPSSTITLTPTPMSCSTPDCTGNWSIVGNGSVVSPGYIRLTTDTMWQSTAMWSNFKLDLAQDWTTEYDMYFGNKDDTGADGIVFVMHNDTEGLAAIGDNGQGISYATADGPEDGISPSLAVEIDTWPNTPSSGDPIPYNDPPNGDPAEDHIGIHINGDGANSVVPQVPASSTQQNIEDGAWHRVRLVWDYVNATTQSITVSFDGVVRQTYSANIINTVFGGQTCVFWGFTSGTGGSSNLQELKEIECLTPTITPTPSRTNTPNGTFTHTPSITRTSTISPTWTYTRTITRSNTPTSTWTYTVGPTPTPVMPLTKTANVSVVSVGDTLTFCLNWSNTSAGAVTMNIWDTPSTFLTYQGCSNACIPPGTLVRWSFAAAAGASGSVCFWGVVNGVPALPFEFETRFALQRRRELDQMFDLCYDAAAAAPPHP